MYSNFNKNFFQLHVRFLIDHSIILFSLNLGTVVYVLPHIKMHIHSLVSRNIIFFFFFVSLLKNIKINYIFQNINNNNLINLSFLQLLFNNSMHFFIYDKIKIYF